MIIGLCGYAGSGKSAVAIELARAMGFERRSFAAPLKNMVRRLLADQGVNTETIERMVNGNLKEIPSLLLHGKSPRYAMQTLGTDWGRALIHDDLWCSAAVAGLQGHEMVLFDDVRFDNEADAIRRVGGKVVRVHRDGVGPVNDHASENPPWADIEVTNDGTLTQLSDTILRAALR